MAEQPHEVAFDNLSFLHAQDVNVFAGKMTRVLVACHFFKWNPSKRSIARPLRIWAIGKRVGKVALASVDGTLN